MLTSCASFLKTHVFDDFKENNLKKYINLVPDRIILPLFIMGGMIAGLGVYIIYESKVYSYLSDKPAVCINCHVMTPYYQSWSRSSHTVWTNCNDCHVPHSSVLSKYYFKAKDGVYHSAVFTITGGPQVIRSRKASNNVIMENCIRCHTQLNTNFVKTGMITYSEAKKGKGKACWDCHTNVPHTRISSLSSSPNAIVPPSKSPVPDWLKNIMKNNSNNKKG
jgi:cytochrome c nitrite reductase small subunit